MARRTFPAATTVVGNEREMPDEPGRAHVQPERTAAESAAYERGSQTMTALWRLVALHSIRNVG